MRPTSIPLGRFAGSIASLATSLMVSVRLDFELENVRGDVLRLLGDALRSDHHGGAADRGRPRPAGAFPDEDFVGIALNVMHLLGIDAEAVAHDLLEDRLMPLALGYAARKQCGSTRLVEPDFRALEALCRRAFDCVRKTDAAQLAALAPFLPAMLEARKVRETKRHIHALLEL